MESITKAPAHDFAPEWLKLPPHNVSNNKKTETDSHQTQRGYTNSFSSLNRKDFLSTISDVPFESTQTQRSFSCNNHNKSLHYLNSRHFSFGDAEQYHNGTAVGNNNGNSDRFTVKNIRKGNDIIERAPFRNDYRDKNLSHNSKSPIRTSYLKTPFDAIIKDSGNNDAVKKKEENSKFNRDFPSLIDDKSRVTNDNSNVQQSAWSNTAAKSKVLSTLKHVQLIQRSVSDFDNHESNAKTIEGNGMSKNPSLYRNMSLIAKVKNVKENANLMNGIGQCAKVFPVLTKSASHVNTSAMEILVKNPKMRGNKSDFLKSFRNESIVKEKVINDNNCRDETNRKNGIDYEKTQIENNMDIDVSCKNIDSNIDESSANKFNGSRNPMSHHGFNGILSSSLEAEHRLLMELGWREEDEEDVPPITEEEKREFEDLISARNGKRNSTINNESMQMIIGTRKLSSRLPFVSVSDAINNDINGRNDFDDDSSSSSDEDFE